MSLVKNAKQAAKHGAGLTGAQIRKMEAANFVLLALYAPPDGFDTSSPEGRETAMRLNQQRENLRDVSDRVPGAQVPEEKGVRLTYIRDVWEQSGGIQARQWLIRLTEEDDEDGRSWGLLHKTADGSVVRTDHPDFDRALHQAEMKAAGGLLERPAAAAV